MSGRFHSTWQGRRSAIVGRLLLVLSLLAAGLAVAVPNDQFASASDLGSAVEASVTLDTRLATRQVGEPAHDGNTSSGTTWWRWTAPADGQWTIGYDRNVSNLSHDLAVYTGSDLEGLVLVGEEGTSPLVVDVSGGTICHFALAGEGLYKLDFSFQPRPANDDFANRSDLGNAVPLSLAGRTVAGTRETGEPLHGNDPSQGPSSWWEWEAPAEGILTVELDGVEDRHWILAAYTGSTVDALTERYTRPIWQDSDDPIVVRTDAGERIAFVVARSTTDEVGALDIKLSFNPVLNNDRRGDAVDLGSAFPVTFSGDTTAATDDDGGAYRTIWWTWTAPSDGIATMRIDEHAYFWNGQMRVHRELPDQSLERVQTAYDQDVDFRVQAGERYFLEVANSSGYGQAMTCSLDLLPAPPNDHFAHRAQLLVGETTFDTTASSGEDDEPGTSISQSLWWSWTSMEEGMLTIAFDYVPFFTLEVYTGSELSSLTRVRYGPGTIGTRAGERYHVRVSSSVSSPTSAVLRTTFQPFDTGHDDFANASDLGAVWSASGAAKLEGTTVEADEPDLGFNTMHSVWWKWTAPDDSLLFVDQQNATGTSYLTLFQGSGLLNLTKPTTTTGAYEATAGEVFYIRIRDASGQPSDGGFVLRAFPNPQVNDHFADATHLGGVDRWTEEVSFFEATREGGEPLHNGDDFPHTLWYQWAPATDQNAEVILDVSFSERIAVYTGASLASLVPVASNGNSPARIRFSATAGESYFIALASQFARRGSWELRSWPLPSGDRFSRPIDLGSAVATPLEGDFNLATVAADDPAPTTPYQVHSLWFRWVAPARGRIEIVTTPFVNGRIRFFEGASLPGLIERDGTSFLVEAGQEYRLLAQGGAGTFSEEIRFVASPDNDDFLDAIDWGSQTMADASLPIHASTVEPGEPEVFPPPGPAPGSVWWRWTAPFDGAVTIRTSYSGIQDNTIALFEGGTLASLVEVGRSTTTAAQATLQANVTAGTTYAILAGSGDTRRDAFWSISLAAVDTPANDLWTGAIDLGNGATAYGAGTNLDATPGEFPEIDTTGGTVWWRWTAPADGTGIAVADIAGESERLFIFREGGGGLVPVVSSRFASGSGSRGETWSASAGVEYFIAVSGYNSGDVGAIDLAVYSVDAPANDHFANRIVLPAVPGVVHGSTVGTTLETGEPEHLFNSDSSSVWWSWTAPANGTYRIMVESADSAILAIYTGAALDQLDQVASSSAGELIWEAASGTSYHIAVVHSNGAQAPCSFTLEPLAPIPNDDFADALDLGDTLPLEVTGYNLGASAEPGEPGHYSGPATRSVWYRWTAPNSELVLVRNEPSSSFPYLGVYTGTAVDNLVSVASGRGRLTFTATAGETYFIAADDQGVPTRPFILTFSAPSVPNDDFADAAVLTSIPPEVPANVTYASVEPGEPRVYQGPYQTLWWEWTADTTTRLRVAVTRPQRRLSIFSLDPGQARTFENLHLERTTTSSTTLDPAVGTIYFFRVESTVPDASGDMNLRFSDLYGNPYSSPSGDDRPANDDFANRIVLAGELPVLGAVDLTGGTVESGEPLYSSYASAWWSWTAPRTGVYRIECVAADNNPSVRVYTGTGVNDLTTLVSTGSSANFEAEAGVEYLIALHSRSYRSGDDTRVEMAASFILSEGPEPAHNDRFADRMDLGSLVGALVPGTNAGAGAEAGEPEHAGTPAERSVWYSWTAPETRAYMVTAVGALMRIGLYTGADPASLIPVASGDAPFLFHADAGTTYQVALDRSGTVEFSLGFYEAPPLPAIATNDAFADAGVLTGGLQTLSVNATESSFEPGEPWHGGDETQEGSLWWTWTAPASGTTRIGMAAFGGLALSDYGRISVYLGESLGALVPFASTPREVVFHAEAGMTYAIVVSDPSSKVFDLTLDQTVQAPPNDLLVDAVGLTGTDVEVAGTTVGASVEFGEPRHTTGTSLPRHSVWYRWTCPESDLYSLTRTDTSSTLLGVYTGTGIASLQMVGTGPSEVLFFATAGTEYFIALAHSYTPDDFTLHLDKPGYAANDHFADRIALGTGSGVPVSGTTINSTREDGEPLHDNDTSPGGTVWWSWTAPEDGEAVIVIDSSSLLLAAYTGTALDDLTLVAEDRGEQLAFPVAAGVHYQIAIGDSSPSYPVGEFEFTIWLDSPVNDDFADRLILPGVVPQEVTGLNHNATSELGEPRLGTTNPTRTLWWEWTPAVTMPVDFRWSSAGGIYTGISLPTLVPVPGEMLGSRLLRFTAEAGTTYLISADSSYSSEEVSFSLAPARAAPANDQFADAIALVGDDVSSDSHSIGATTEPGEPVDAERSLWWTWTAPRDGMVDLAARGGTTYLFGPGAVMKDLEPETPWRDSIYRVTAGTTYNVMVASTSGRDLTLSVEMTPEGDMFDLPVSVGNLEAVQLELALSGATWESFEPLHGGSLPEQSVWMSWTAPYSGPVRLRAGGSWRDLRLAVYRGFVITQLSPVAEGEYELQFGAVGGTAYRIAVDAPSSGYPPSQFAFQLVTEPAGYADWRDGFSPSFGDPDFAPLANYDGDALPNLFEYAFGKNPRHFDGGEIPFTIWNLAGYVCLSVERPQGVEGVRYSFEITDDLQAGWWWTADLDRLQWAVDQEGGTELFHILLTDYRYEEQSSFFARLRVDLGSDPLEE